MERVRVGIIGMGNMGRFHANDLLDGKAQRAQLTAAGSTSPHKLEGFNKKGVQIFGGAAEMIASGTVDALLIATPHYEHTSVGISALDAGLHIMVEKPISAHKADAERLIAKAEEHPELTFAGMFQLRVEPRYQKIREIVQGDELGDLMRVI